MDTINKNNEFNADEIDAAVTKQLQDNAGNGDAGAGDGAKKKEEETAGGAGDGAADNKETTKKDEIKEPTAEEKAAIEAKAKTDAEEKEKRQQIANEYLKSIGFETEDELKAALAKVAKKDETPDEKAARENIEKGEFVAFAAKNGIKVDDLHNYEAIKAKADKDIVFEKFLVDFKAENPEINAAEIEAKAKEEFDAEYKLAHPNEKTKARGESRLAKEAAEIRSPLEKVYSSVQEKFNETRSHLAKMPEFAKFVERHTKDSIPTTIEVFKKGDITANFNITPEEKKAIVDTVLNKPEVFAEFSKNKNPQQVDEFVKRKIEEAIHLRNKDKIATVISEASFSIGTKSGSTVGANQPFALHKKQQQKEKAAPGKEDAKKNVVDYMENEF